MAQEQRLLIIVGPTASGKSALAVSLAKAFGGEVISADSRQVYRGLDIGTGKITNREMRGVRHHLLDVASPKQQFTAHNYATSARKAIADISARGKLPIVCGGTGFYIDALLGRVALSEVPPDKRLRAVLEKRSSAQLLTLLERRDPRRAKNIDPRNKRRIIRALEIAAGRPRATPARDTPHYRAFWLGLDPINPRKRISERLSARLKAGMIAEAKRLHEGGLSYKRMRELGLEYRTLASFLQGTVSRVELQRELEYAIWQYARRQRTYWRRNSDIRWFPGPARGPERAVASWLSRR